MPQAVVHLKNFEHLREHQVTAASFRRTGLTYRSMLAMQCCGIDSDAPDRQQRRAS